VALAEVARPHGVRGEVKLRPYNQDSELLLEVEDVLLRTKTGAERPVVITGARRVPDAFLVTFANVHDRDEVDALRGAVLCVRREDFPPLEDGEFYACDVEGARVVHEGSELGRVTAMKSYPTVDVLLVVGDKQWEVPLTDAFVERIDMETHTVELRSMDGLEPER
jgi:16S rRNA processing protein RimM